MRQSNYCSQELKRLETQETIICPCGRLHALRSYIGQEKPPQSPDHPEFMEIYGKGQPSSSEAASVSSDPRASNAIRKAPSREVAGSIDCAPKDPAVIGHQMPIRSDLDDIPPSSPTEIKVSTWRSDPNQNSSASPGIRRQFSGQPFNNITDQEWPLNEIIGSRMVGNEREFEIRWAESTLQKTYLNESEDGKYFVFIDGVKWDIESHEVIESDDEFVETCIVKWPATWKPERGLLNARELIEEFERRAAEQIATPTDSEPRHSIERQPPVNEDSQLSGDAQSVVLEEWEHIPLPTPKVSNMRFKPKAMEVYHGADFREIFARNLDVPHSFLRLWEAEMDQRGLIFRRKFIDSGRDFDLWRGEKRRAVFDYICGVEQHEQCDACKRGLGPFPKCIVSPSSSHGACANCTCGWSAKKCNFHHETVKEYRPSELDQLLTPPPSSPMSESLIDPGSPIPYRTEPSPELGDPNFYMTPEPRKTTVAPVENAGGVHGADHAGATSDKGAVPVDEEPRSRRSKRSTPSEPSSSPPESDGTERSLPIRPAKSLRLSNTATPSGSRLRAEVAFCVSTAMAIWKPTSFRHPGCGMDVNSVCLQADDGSPAAYNEHQARQAADRVMSGRQFTDGEATDAEVQYVLRKCPCSFFESFRDGWQNWTYESGVHCTLETFVSNFYIKKLNEAMERFCQYRIRYMNGIPVIVLE